MKKVLCHIIVLTLCVLMVACAADVRDASRLQSQILKQTAHATEVTETLKASMQTSSFDSVWNITHQESDLLFYVFGSHGLVYWSQNWLAGKEVRLTRYNQWYYQQFDNAHCICSWTRAGEYDILTILPIKYNYAFENSQLHNTFLPAFTPSKDWDISPLKKAEHISINDAEGRFLFSLCPCHLSEKKEAESTRLAESFSYQNLLTTGTDDDETGAIGAHAKVRIYFLLSLLMFAVLIIIGVVELVKSRGLENMNLRTKFQMTLIFSLFFGFFFIFILSISHVRQHYQATQRHNLINKTTYVQKALQETYSWQASLSSRNMHGLSVDLRDLSFTYQTDLHVYDMDGNLVGTSAPTLFDKGLLSTHMSPRPFFAESPNMVLEEQIGDMHYLCSYAPFYNGSYVQIGFIAVPLFVSTDELVAEVDAFLSKLLPIYLIVLLLAFVVSWIEARELTRPLNSLAKKMSEFRIGQSTNKLAYSHHNEIGQLVEHYNQMVDALEQSTNQLAQTEREGAWQIMARQIAHEINNVLTPMKLTIQSLQRKKGTDKFESSFERDAPVLIEQIDSLSHIAASFSTIAKMPEVRPAEVDVAQKLSVVIALFRNNQDNVPIRYVGPESGAVAYTDPELISQVFTNLIKNALQAIEHRDEGDIIVMLKNGDMELEISISDNGCGIPKDAQDKIFRPNFTTKSTGMGLGLTLVKSIIDASRGNISFETSKKGTTFFVHLRKKL